MFSFTRQHLASIYSAAFPDLGVHDTSASKANDQGATQGFYRFGTPHHGVQLSSDPGTPSNNKGLPRKDIDKANGSTPGSAGIRNSSTPVDSYGSSEHEHEQIPAKLPDDEILPPDVERGAPGAEDETDFSQPRVRRRQSAAFPSFLYKLADTKDPSVTSDQSSINSSTIMFGAATEESFSPKNARNNFPTEADSQLKESSRLQSIPEKETPATSVRFSFVLDESIAKKMAEAGRLRRTQSQNLNSVANSRPQKPTSEPPDSTQELPRDVPQSILSSTDPHSDCRRDLKTLQDLYDRQLTELKESRETVERLKAENLREKALLSKSIHDASILRQENQTSRQRISILKEHLSTVTTELNDLKKEKLGWQEQLDAMQHRVQQAERQARCLDNLTRLKLEAREDGAFGSVKRTKQFQASNLKASAEVIRLVISLNREIMQSANLAAENLGCIKIRHFDASAHVRRSTDVLGNKFTTLLQKHATLYSDFRPFLVQVLLELFMVHWCTQIIEGWYPKQKCFADVLLEFSQTTNSSIGPDARVDHGKIKILQTSVSIDYPGWVSDILKDLNQILSVGGVWIDTSLLKSKFLTLVKLAYEVRTALAEKDLCGGLELLIVGSGMPFQHKWMNERHSLDRAISVSTMKMDPVVGTCRVGLRRVGKTPPISTSISANENVDVVLKPAVILEKLLDEEAP
ncbi:hypothetical protein D9613_002543 [Agrocybe pediades]|uniref:Uncharacterized protein n=1 Tax=Agrocybe pediades TaxID=84607 RepID=A0A8H4VL40_9AGAR|nr:hypothetical protein D9613_002543 [Agrocybe pediades]